ncbi:TetR/AcrR family transcriptional regulator [Dinghuibacter silviterrae]|uniref:TetR family transcriptional regulator n=1 Tax=Dinghuibacter silviterrae TaxID=1539049 RepID=A0A4R8DG96_9BACT|nr:TetR/AcrR family transcriptional regulator [Dinghuibacter silviterrae]TDW96659.1 TetR family transcriptional regulator [Dinghuibacter silviterrae]
MSDVLNTETVIRNAARKIFTSKGFDGTTVQDIADEAGTTKSMVNYYFRSKEKLFSSIFQEEFQHFFAVIATYLNADLPLRDKIAQIVELDTNKFSAFPELPVFVMSEVNRNPGIVLSLIGKVSTKEFLAVLTKQIDAESKKGVIKKIKAEDLLLNIQALTIFPFINRPLMMKLFNLTELQYVHKINERKKQIADIIWDSIKI